MGCRSLAQQLEDAHVKYINMFAKCNTGFCYYPTKIGTVYPGMKGDMFGDPLRECHKRDIGVIKTAADDEFVFDGPHAGICRMLGELKYTYNFVNETMDLSPISC